MSERDLVFLSYASEDYNQVRKVYEGLKKRKLNPWIDKEDLKTEIALEAIKRTIAHSKSYVFFLSNSALKKTSFKKPGFLDNELQTAWTFAQENAAKDFQFAVARLEDCDRGDLRIRNRNQIDLFPDFEKGLDKLALNLGGVSLADDTAIDKRTEEEREIDSMKGKASTFWYSGELERAKSNVEEIISIKPDHESWNHNGVILAGLSRLNEALKAYDMAIKINSDFPVAWYNRGKVLADLDRHNEAIESFKQTTEIEPDFWAAWFHKGKSLACLGRHDEANDAFDKAKEIKTDAWAVWFQMGKSLACLGRHDEANDAFDKAKEIKPDAWAVWFHKGESLACLGRQDEANEAFKKAKDAFTKSEGDKG